MSDRSPQCPFINRDDDRCAGHFRLDRLQDALGLCCGRYQTCRVYYELLVERRIRQVAARQPAGAAHASSAPAPIQLTIAAALKKPLRHVA